MFCPRCGTRMQGGICPMCGFPVNRLRKKVRSNRKAGYIRLFISVK